MRERAGRPMLLIDLAVPRDIDAACAQLDGRLAVRHRRPAGGGRAQPPRPPGRGAQGRGDHRGGDPAVRRLAGLARGAADGGRAARPRQRRSPTQVVGENARQVGDRLAARPRARSTPSPARSSTGCCTSRPLQMKEMRDDRVHARMALRPRAVRPQRGGGRRRAGEEPTTPEPAPRCASCRPRARARPAGGLMRIGTRGSALALAQAESVADAARARTPRSSQITTLGRPRRGVERQVALGLRARAGAARRADRRRRALGQGRADRAAPTASSWWRSRARADARDAICGAAGARRAGAGARGRDQQPAPRRPDARRPRRPRGRASCAATSTPGCASSPTGEVDALVLAAGRAAAARARRRRPAACSTSSCPPPGRARWRSRRGRATIEPRRAGARSATLGADGVRGRRASARARARRLVQHPGRRPCAAAGRRPAVELTGWVGLPDGSAWLRDRVHAAAAEAAGARAPSGCSPRAPPSCCERPSGGAGGVTVYLVGAGPGDPG